MDTLQLDPKVRVRMPEFLRWVVVGLSFLLVATTWWVSDLWRLATWPAHQIELDGAMPRRSLAILTGFVVAILLGEAAVTWMTISHSFHVLEWAMLSFALFFLYFVATFIRVID